MSIPPDFDELAEDIDVFYRIEPDGSVLLTGEKNTCLLKRDLKDGSKILGGINRNGMLFGERIAIVNNQVTKYPLYWRDTAVPAPRIKVNEVARTPPPSSIDNPAFDRNRLPDLSARHTQTTLPIQPTPVDAQDLREAKDRVSKSIADADKSASKSSVGQRMRRLLRRAPDGGSDGTDANIEALTEAADAIEKTMAEVEQVRGENVHNAQELQNALAENNKLRDEIQRIRAESRTLLAETIAEFARKVKTRRWQVEAVDAREVITEGMESKMLEVEDPEGLMRYVVVSIVPSGTEQHVLAQWQKDLKAKVDLMPFGQRAVYVLARENFKVNVLELVPGVDVENTTDQL